MTTVLIELHLFFQKKVFYTIFQQMSSVKSAEQSCHISKVQLCMFAWFVHTKEWLAVWYELTAAVTQRRVNTHWTRRVKLTSVNTGGGNIYWKFLQEKSDRNILWDKKVRTSHSSCYCNYTIYTPHVQHRVLLCNAACLQHSGVTLHGTDQSFTLRQRQSHTPHARDHIYLRKGQGSPGSDNCRHWWLKVVAAFPFSGSGIPQSVNVAAELSNFYPQL